MKTTFKTIKNFPNYIIYECGTVKSILTGNIKSHRNAGAGYRVTDLYHKGKQNTLYIHRLVALAFLHRDDETLEINHKDGDKHNNHVDNLEWVTHKENSIHRNATGIGDRGIKKSNNTSGYVGVSRNGGRWKASIRINGKSKHIGSFIDIIDAARAYNKASIKYHGDSGKQNVL